MKEILHINTVDDIRIIDILHVQKEHDYSKDYLTFEALEDGTFTLRIFENVDSTCMTSVSYSTDNGETWIDTAIDNNRQTIKTPTITSGNKVLWKGVGKQMAKVSNSNGSAFDSTCNFNVYGNIMSLLYGDDFQDKTTFSSGSKYNFKDLFSNAQKLVSAKNLILPATTLAPYCYSQLFSSCSIMIDYPKLPATTLASHCYEYMFDGCTSLTTAPELPATTLSYECYQGMFFSCTGLVTAPELPATTLAYGCYMCMFENCTSLTTAPILPATTLAENCYQIMFYGCTSLTTAPKLPVTKLADRCYNSMFYGCTSLTTAPELPATTLRSNCYGSMFNDCTSLTSAPELPATKLEPYCYYNMFSGCTALTVAPELPATKLTSNCYSYIFENCHNLNHIKAMFTTTPSDTYTKGWVSGVAATGTFIKNSAATWNVIGNNGIPADWTVETADS